MSRPHQVGIDRLPARRANEQVKEAMNCKSCRKRKIKCNRLRPSCEACQIFACPCIYDAVPKKRGPKTDVLEALLKRVDGLEKRLRNGTNDGDHTVPVTAVKEAILEAVRNSSSPDDRLLDVSPQKETSSASSPPDISLPAAAQLQPTPSARSDAEASLSADYVRILLDAYFNRVHGKPYHILDEALTRQQIFNNQLPDHLSFAIFAVSARYTIGSTSYVQAITNAREYARRARLGLDIDDPSIQGIQTLFLLSQAMFQEGSGKKAYMYLSSAVTMALALNLHREVPANIAITPNERELRRRLFWSCYLSDRFSATGSKRPSLVSDECILLRLPAPGSGGNSLGREGDFFANSTNLQFMSNSGTAALCGNGMLIGIARVLGITNRYLAAGGVKGDSHFPWHASSTLSKIRQELDYFAADTQATFSSIEALFGQPDSVLLVLSKLIYHLIHCLVYRPFLPVDLAELEHASQHQSWQIEATNLCFLHANAVTELVEIGKSSGITDWPSFVCYCVCTAGTIHVHGAHYQGNPGEVVAMSAEFLTRDVQQLTDLMYIWEGVQHQKDTLLTLYGAHCELVKSLATNPIRFSPVFQMEDFFDRYPGYFFDGAHITLNDKGDAAQTPSDEEHMMGATQQITNARLPSSGAETEAAIQHGLFSTGTPTSWSHQRPPFHGRRATEPLLRQSSATDLSTSPGSAITYQQPYPTSAMQQQVNGVQFNSLLSGSQTPNFSYGLNQIPMQQPSSNIPEMHRYDPMLSGATQFDQISGSANLTPGTMLRQPHFGTDMSRARMSVDSGAPPDEVDPFLALLEQLAENEQSRGGPSELDFFLSSAS